MIFNLGKSNKTSGSPSIEQDTIERWREASRKSSSKQSSQENWILVPAKNTEPVSTEQIFSLDDNDSTDGLDRASLEPADDAGFSDSSESCFESTVVKKEMTEKERGKRQGKFLLEKTPSSDPSLSIEEDLKRRFGANLRSAIGPGTIIEGKMVFELPVRVDGSIFGELASSSTVIIGEDAVVQAELRVGSLIVLGRVIGNVASRDLIEIKSSGHLEGNICTKRFVVDLGGFFEGECNTARSS